MYLQKREKCGTRFSKKVCTRYVPVHTGRRLEKCVLLASSTYFYQAVCTWYIPSTYFSGQYVPSTYLGKEYVPVRTWGKKYVLGQGSTSRYSTITWYVPSTYRYVLSTYNRSRFQMMWPTVTCSTVAARWARRLIRVPLARANAAFQVQVQLESPFHFVITFGNSEVRRKGRTGIYRAPGPGQRATIRWRRLQDIATILLILSLTSGILAPWIRMIILIYTSLRISCVDRLIYHAAWYHDLKWDIPFKAFRAWYHDLLVHKLVYIQVYDFHKSKYLYI